MKRIAILASGHGGSTLPLAKAFLNQGYAVDYYMIANAVGVESQIEATDLTYTTQSIGLQQISLSNSPHLNEYIDSVNFRFFSITLQRPFRNVPIVRDVMRIVRNFTIRDICDVINKENYEFVNIVGRYNLEEIATYSKHIKSKISVSLHEVCNHSKPDYKKPSALLKYLFKYQIDIVVHSSKSYNDILSYSACKKGKIHLIPFGLFDTYFALANAGSLVLPSNYFLFIGGFSEYKGIDLFIKAVDSIKDAKGYNFVIAGSGRCDAIQQIQNKERFHIINRFLSNVEFAEILKKSTMVVCPYRTASQSGIPQSALVFGKPMLVSDIESFHSIIHDGVEGVYHKPCDVVDLAQQIEKIINSPTLINDLSLNASRFCEHNIEYRWDSIAEKYLNI